MKSITIFVILLIPVLLLPRAHGQEKPEVVQIEQPLPNLANTTDSLQLLYEKVNIQLEQYEQSPTQENKLRLQAVMAETGEELHDLGEQMRMLQAEINSLTQKSFDKRSYEKVRAMLRKQAVNRGKEIQALFHELDAAQRPTTNDVAKQLEQVIAVKTLARKQYTRALIAHLYRNLFPLIFRPSPAFGRELLEKFIADTMVAKIIKGESGKFIQAYLAANPLPKDDAAACEMITAWLADYCIRLWREEQVEAKKILMMPIPGRNAEIWHEK
jgi:hypothetical protein